jgi:hypothetical protein
MEFDVQVKLAVYRHFAETRHRPSPKESDWLFHCLVPAAKWWHDIVFT